MATSGAKEPYGMAQFHQLAVPKDGSVNGDVLRLDGRATSKMHAN
jgi:hypothetical protein